MTSKYGTKAGFGPVTRPINTVLYPSGFKDNLVPEYDRTGAEADTKLGLDLFKCPADDGPPRGAHCADWIENPDRSSFDHFGNSYAANLFMIHAGNDPMESNSPYLRPVTRIPVPARTLYFEENIGRWAWAARREICPIVQPGVDPGPTKAIRGWHGTDWTYNRAFVDGHAEYQKVYIEGSEDAGGYAKHYRVEKTLEDPQEQSQYQCVIVRGQGWQKDTLPQKPIPTGLLYPGNGRPSYEDCVNSN